MSEQFPEYTEEVGACKECGNSPTNHFLTKIASTVDVYTGTFAKKRERSDAFRKFRYHFQHPGERLERICFGLLQVLGLLHYGDDPRKAKSYRSRVIWEEALRRDIPMEQLYIFGAATDVYRAKISGNWIFFVSLPIPPWADRVATDWAGDKFLLKEALHAQNIPVPRFTSAQKFPEGLDFFKKVQVPVIVKPRVGTRGRHTTVHVTTEDDLKLAFESAKKLCDFVSVEEELQGGVCRGTVVNGKLVGFFQAEPAQVIGNGVSTIQSLIDAANNSREERVAAIEVTDESLAYLSRSGYTLKSVPEKGVKVTIGHRTGRLFGGKTRELLENVHPKLRATLERAAHALGIVVVGFDLIIQDPEADPDTQQWGIIEANTLPFIDLHYLPLEGKPSNPAAAIWDLWDQS